MGIKGKNHFTIILFAISLVVLGFMVGQYYVSKVYRQQVEAGYRRALGEFASHLQELGTEIGRARLAESESQRQQISTNIRRLVYAIQGNMGELPLGELELQRMSHLLERVYSRTFDQGEIEELYVQIKFVDQELQRLLSRKEEEFPWVNWHEYLTASPIIPGFLQGFTLINEGLQDFQTPIRSGEIMGTEISKEEAVQIAEDFLRREVVLQLTNESKGAVPAYTIEAKEGNERIVLEISQRGGAVLWMASTKEVVETRLTLDEMIGHAEDFLGERGFPPLHLTDAQVLQHRAILTFVPKRQNVLRYGEPIKIQVGADDGSILGFWGTPFHAAQSRQEQGELVSIEEVKWNVNEKIRAGVEILDAKLAAIPLKGEEVLVKRLGVEYRGDYYLLYLNAQTGEEEQIVSVSSPKFF